MMRYIKNPCTPCSVVTDVKHGHGQRNHFLYQTVGAFLLLVGLSDTESKEIVSFLEPTFSTYSMNCTFPYFCFSFGNLMFPHGAKGGESSLRIFKSEFKYEFKVAFGGLGSKVAE